MSSLPSASAALRRLAGLATLGLGLVAVRTVFLPAECSFLVAGLTQNAVEGASPRAGGVVLRNLGDETVAIQTIQALGDDGWVPAPTGPVRVAPDGSVLALLPSTQGAAGERGVPRVRVVIEPRPGAAAARRVLDLEVR